ncbi:MAG: hypothetical protein GF387_00500 [Candidatus Portnoybacteria bacterium]|nr:hypothetical protein [Candidatus Portnoybacteria bacterium]
MEEIKKTIEELERELASIQDTKKRNEQRQRIKDLWKKYKGDDEVISSEEYLKIIEKQKRATELKLMTEIPRLDNIIEGFREGNLVVVSGATKQGKCFGKGTKVLMYSGKTKNVEDVEVGDLLMGNDSTPRRVLSLGRGRETMYKITQKNGDYYIVNESHILSLKRTGTNKWRRDNPRKIKRKRKNRKGEVVNIEVGDYLKKSKTFKHIHKGYYSGLVKFKKKKIDIEPYFLGLWLGDGTASKPDVTTADNEIVKYLHNYAKRLGLKVRVAIQKNNKSSVCSLVREKRFKPTDKRHKGGYGNITSLISLLRKNNLINNKHIPLNFKTNSKKARLELLAGLIDSDGYINGKYNICFCNKNKRLIDDFIFLAKSLGFSVGSWTKNINGIDYYIVNIGGNLKEIPLKIKRKMPDKTSVKEKDILNSSIKIEKIGTDDYYGFEIDGNKLFLLANFVVVHNTSFCQTLTENFEEKSLWFTFEVPVAEFMEKFNEVPLFYLPRTLKGNTTTWIEKRIVEAIAKYDIKAVFIDHLHYVVDLNSLHSNVSIQIGATMRELKRIALKWGLAIFLVAHIKKTKINDVPDIDDLRDSSFVAQESDIVMMVSRLKDEEKQLTTQSLVSVLAHRRTGKVGQVKLNYHDNKFSEVSQGYEELFSD